MTRAALYLVAACLLVVLLLWTRYQYQQQFDSLNSIIKEQNGVITYWQTEAGKVASTKPAAEIMKSDLNDHYPEIVKEIKDLRIEIKNLRAISKASFEAIGEGKIKIIHDTIELPGYIPFIRDSVFIDDHYMKLKAQVIPGTHDSYLAYKYIYQDTVIAAVAWKRKGWFGKRSLEGTFRLSNPKARAISQTSILISEKPKRFYVGVGASYNPFTNTFAPSVHAGMAIIKF